MFIYFQGVQDQVNSKGRNFYYRVLQTVGGPTLRGCQAGPVPWSPLSRGCAHTQVCVHHGAVQDTILRRVLWTKNPKSR